MELIDFRGLARRRRRDVDWRRSSCGEGHSVLDDSDVVVEELVVTIKGVVRRYRSDAFRPLQLVAHSSSSHLLP